MPARSFSQTIHFAKTLPLENIVWQLINLPTGRLCDSNMQHLKASLVGVEIKCKATIKTVEGRKYT